MSADRHHGVLFKTANRDGTKPTNLVEAFEFLSTKVGLVVAILGFMHFTNMRFLMRYWTAKHFKVVDINILCRLFQHQCRRRAAFAGLNHNCGG